MYRPLYILTLLLLCVVDIQADPVTIGVGPSLTSTDRQLLTTIQQEFPDSRIVRRDSTHTLLKQVEEGEVDIAIGSITITAAREASVDFTSPYKVSSIKVLHTPPSFLLRYLTTIWIPVTYFTGFLIVSGLIFYLLEYGSNKALSDNLWDGWFDGTYMSGATATTVGFGDKTPLRKSAKLWAYIVALIGISYFSILTGISASTWDECNSTGPELHEMDDILTIRGSTSSQYLTSKGITHRTTTNDLNSEKAKYIMYDAVLLEDHVTEDRVLSTRTYGPIQPYGIAVANSSKLKDKLNRMLTNVL